MKRQATLWAIAIALSLQQPAPAGAMVKLCLARPSLTSVVDVPPHPVLVVERRALDYRGTDAFRTFTGYRDGAMVPNRPLRYTVQDIDADWVRVVVDATDGVQFYASSVVGAACSGVTYKVVSDAVASDGGGLLFTKATTFLVGDTRRLWTLEPRPQAHRSWTRIEWAYDISVVDAGRGSVAAEQQPERLYITTPPEKTVLYMKVIRYHVDGTVSFTRSKLSRVGDAITIEDLPDTN